MGISINEVRKRAIEFAHEWEDVTRENAEAQTFWNSFFNVFGVHRRRVAAFEDPIKNLPGDKKGRIDLFWKGKLIVEHKSRGKSLDRAFTQAVDYFPGIEEKDLPKYILVSDFERFRLYDLDKNKEHEFKLRDLHKNIHLFEFIRGGEKQEIIEEDPVNIKAAQLMGELHDALKASGYTGHQLEVFLVRIMFCLFADDSDIFEKNQFMDYIENRTNEDGSDLGMHISQIFQILNTPESDRQKNLDEDLATFRYIDGLLFEEQLKMPSFDSEMRAILLRCCQFDWSTVSPAIFGSLFQSVMDRDKRRDIGAHYTTERNILKVVKSLFLDELRGEFEKSRRNAFKLNELLEKIARLRFLDPACGCGNFLVIAYRELRSLEIDIRRQLKKLSGYDQKTIDIELDKGIDVDAFYGIEIEEFPARIAQAALWLVDHQMNIRLQEELGFYYVRFPLKKTPHIEIGNALRKDWNEIIDKKRLSYILGNPPYAGKKRRNADQNEDMKTVLEKQIPNYGLLDYVACWYMKATEYIQGTQIKVAFVSTNSISQGEQVGILWSALLSKRIIIHFAHRTFAWASEAKGKAAVFVVIIGFSTIDVGDKTLFDYHNPKSEPVAMKVKHINPYLVDQVDFVIPSRRKSICEAPPIMFGSMPNDDGNLIFTDIEKNQFLTDDPAAERYFRPLISAREFLSGEKRWCLWLQGAEPSDIQSHNGILTRIEKVREYRASSQRLGTKKLAKYPMLFGETRQPSTDYILIPRHSSENRMYIPMAFLSKDNIASDSCCIVPGGTLFHFGVLMSSMHMAWVRQICGRIKGDFRYSNTVVYNNYPWPEKPSAKNIKEVENAVKEILSARERCAISSLADLYNPLTTPEDLMKAHLKLDKAVDKCYRPKPFTTELARLRHLFQLYRKYAPDSQNTNLDQYAESEE